MQVRELEVMLEEEKTQRAQALTVKKQLETELQEAEAQVETANRSREEAVRQMKRLQVCLIEMYAAAGCDVISLKYLLQTIMPFLLY